VVWFILGAMAESVAMGWLFVRANGNVLVAGIDVTP
jgi:hypothetical protein